MLDCDLCHQWFHGACMGVPDNTDSESWYCDHCRLSTAVDRQRSRMLRLLALPDPSSGGGGGGDASMADADGDASPGGAPPSEAERKASAVHGRVHVHVMLEHMPVHVHVLLSRVRVVSQQVFASEEETTKALVLNYLEATASGDPAADTAQTHLLCEWHYAALLEKQQLLCQVHRTTTRESAPEPQPSPTHSLPHRVSQPTPPHPCQVYDEQGRLAMQKRRKDRAVGTLVSFLPPAPLLSRDGITAATRRLMADTGVYAKGEVMLTPLLAVSRRLSSALALSHLLSFSLVCSLQLMLTHLLHMLKDPQTTARTKAIKALREIVRVDPATLSLKNVIRGVQIALQSPYMCTLSYAMCIVMHTGDARRPDRPTGPIHVHVHVHVHPLICHVRCMHTGDARRPDCPAGHLDRRARGGARLARWLPLVAPRVCPQVLRRDRASPTRLPAACNSHRPLLHAFTGTTA